MNSFKYRIHLRFQKVNIGELGTFVFQFIQTGGNIRKANITESYLFLVYQLPESFPVALVKTVPQRMQVIGQLLEVLFKNGHGRMGIILVNSGKEVTVKVRIQFKNIFSHRSLYTMLFHISGSYNINIIAGRCK